METSGESVGVSMNRYQFGLNWLLVLTLVVAAYFAGRSSLERQLLKANRDLINAEKKIAEVSRLNVALSQQKRPPHIIPKITRIDDSHQLRGIDRESFAEKLNIKERIDRTENEINAHQTP